MEKHAGIILKHKGFTFLICFLVTAFTLAKTFGEKHLYTGTNIKTARRSTSTVKKPAPIANTRTYTADITHGIIGYIGSSHLDQAFDNVFHIHLPAAPAKDEVVMLRYRLKGLASLTSVARSINEAQSTGGYFAILNDTWTVQEEYLPKEAVRRGDNSIQFGLPDGADFHYEVADVSLLITKKNQPSAIILNNEEHADFGTHVYLKGILTSAGKLFCNDRPVATEKGEFEIYLPKPQQNNQPLSLVLKAVLANGKTESKTLVINHAKKAEQRFEYENKGISARSFFNVKSGLHLKLVQEKYTASLSLAPGAMPGNKLISMTALRQSDLAPLNTDMVNVTGGAQAYRFLPHGSGFKIPAHISLPYDASKLPEGYTPADIRTYYFDPIKRTWLQLPIDTVKEKTASVESTSTHFTDMINGIIKVPESPQTQGYTPTSIKDYKMADPSNGIEMIAPPTANNMGTANLSFPFKLPKGRQGLQPNLSLSYSSEGGNGWAGLGWNISIPAMGIDTRWGVPRYDNALETETYSFNSEQLAPIANRTEYLPRTAEKQFYRRVEGGFEKIIRHGDRPSNYWWEVTNKSGIRSFYGGTPASGVLNNAVLKDAAGNIAHWGLTETRDLHDNFIRYQYTQVSDVGISGGTVNGIQLYISKIFYTGSNTKDGPYTVEFIRSSQLDEGRRKDIEISGRLGFKMVTADLIRNIRITYENQLIRSYDLEYQEGEFYKTLLKSISELDNKGVVFSTHGFDYHNDVRSGSGLTVLTGEEDWSPANDHIKGNFINSISGFTDESSALSTVKSKSSGAGLALTVGFDLPFSFLSQDKSMTVGGSVGTESGSSEGLVNMVDINGDGLPDKIFKKGDDLFYRANLGLTAHAFGDIRPIIGINNFSYTSSKTTKKGVQIIPPFSFLGYESSRTTNRTTDYFSDFNGDGLMDVSINGTVFFNHLDGNGNPVFEAVSTNTPNPISTGGALDDSFFKPDLALQKEQEQDFPLQDAVRFWQAPFDGQVTINGSLQLLPYTGSGIADPKQDGVRVSIQVGDNERWSETVKNGDYTVKTPNNVNNITIQKGDKIFFRVQSIYNGNGDQVKWDPEIRYQNTLSPLTDANNRQTARYKASEDFVLDNRNGTNMVKTGKIDVDGKFEKAATSDTVTLKVILQSASGKQTVFTKSYGPAAVVSEDILINGVNVTGSDALQFLVESDSYIDRTALKWTPHYRYISSSDLAPVLTPQNKPLFEGWPVANNSNFNDWKIQISPYDSKIDSLAEITPTINADATANGEVTFTVKRNGSIVLKKKLTVASGAFTSTGPAMLLALKAGNQYFLDYACSSPTLATSIQQVGAIIKYGTKADTVKANLFTNPISGYLGSMFRGWGQFSYKGDKGNVPIDQTKLQMAQWSGYASDPNQYVGKDTSDFKNLPNPTQADFMPMVADSRRNAWLGLDSAVYVSPNEVASSRLWLHDVAVDSLLKGSGLTAVPKIRVSKTTSYSLGGNTPSGFVFKANASFSKSSGTTTTQLDMMDMNGDRYPDVLNPDNVQYTKSAGFLEATARSAHGLGGNTSSGSTEGVTLGGHFAKAKSNEATSYNSLTEEAVANASIGLTGNIGSNDEHSKNSWLDVNGDGLPDKVFDNGYVALNLGYSFAPAENWGIAAIDKNQSKTAGGGLGGGTGLASAIGENLVSGSFEAGFGLTRSTGISSYTLSDINGDGLIDQLYEDGVQLGTGGGFGPKISWTGLSAFASNVSTGESANVAFTIAFTLGFIPIKIAINPSYNTSHGFSREKDQIMDMDGDGYPDILHSENDGNLKIKRSLIGRTNMLRSVQRPMGGMFTVDYQRTDNSYNMPNNKWVLTYVSIFDGVKGDGVDTIRHRFSYSSGLYNRREREFYGFATVKTDQLNTADRNVVYRSTVQQFINSSYYAKSLSKSEWLQDAAGRKFNQTDYTYDIRKVQDSVYFPALLQTSKYFYEGQATPGASTSTHLDYDALGNVTKITDRGDGSAADMTMATVAYHDNNSLYIKGIPKNIEVTTIEGLKRKRSTTINNTGDITQINQYLADGTASTYDLKYDTYGNLSKITRPKNYNNERLWYAYEYDPAVNTYVTKVTDAYGYTSTSSYEYLFGNLTGTLSMNKEPMRFGIDNRGRVKDVTGPYELAAGKPYTIAFEYFPDAVTPYAITHHYDPEYNSDINTITFMDGMGRGIQVKKNISLFTGKNKPDVLNMVVSGRSIFDAFGRAIKSYYPVTEGISAGNTVLNNTLGNINTLDDFDVQDRPVKQVLADASATSMSYKVTDGIFTETTTDALGNITELKTDVKERKREQNHPNGPNGAISTKFGYNALSELLNVTDNSNHVTRYAYDNLGRKVSASYPDAGTTAFVYDPAGNLTKKITAQIKKEIPNEGAINYLYEYERITGIDYPRQYQNRVSYKYGAPDMGDRAGRLILQQDASGGLEYYYGKLGEITKQIRTVMVSSIFYTTYVSEQSYDTWNRLKTMTYPDGEHLTYHYNQGGSLKSIDGKKQGNVYPYVDQLGYDEYEQRVYLKYGNGTETSYSYDDKRRRLTALKASTAGGRYMMDNVYSYDAVSNILGITNNAKAEAGKLGGYASQTYKYDNLYRLTEAKGIYRGNNDTANFALTMQYDNLYNILNKKLITQIPTNSYNLAYQYNANPHQASKIGNTDFTYDLNGNSLGSLNQKNFWDEDNRMMGNITNNVLSEYTYDAGGERVVKSSGGIQGTWVNGAPAGTIQHNDNYTVYVSPYLVCRRTGFTKHIYIENQRIATKVGNGSFTNISFPQAALTAGGVNYLERASNLKQQRIAYYASLPNRAPGPPTQKLFYLEPQNSGLAAPILLDNTASSVPAGWPGNTSKPLTGPPAYVDPIPSNDSVKAGYGFSGTGHFYENQEYFYHPDHLGSTAYITNLLGEVSQHLEYIPFGETLVDEHQGSLQTPYLFNAKERDAETSYYYYGARYYDARASQWLSVDPMVDKYPGLSPYNYTLNNPVKFVDPDGNGTYYNEGGLSLGNDNINDNKVYVANGKKSDGSFENSRLLNVTHSNFLFMAQTLYAESDSRSSNFEVAGIFSVLENRAQAYGTDVITQMSPKQPMGVYGSSEEGRKRYSSERGSEADAKRLNVRAGLILGLTSSTDYSNGAFFWDGVDFETKGGYRDRYLPGYFFSDKSHDIYNLGNNIKPGSTNFGSWNYKYESTGVRGKTTFSRLTYDWRDAQYPGKKISKPLGD